MHREGFKRLKAEKKSPLFCFVTACSAVIKLNFLYSFPYFILHIELVVMGKNQGFDKTLWLAVNRRLSVTLQGQIKQALNEKIKENLNSPGYGC
jgi:hypothetical protein